MRLPGTKRTARGPDGRCWRVGRRWTATSRPQLRRDKRKHERDGGYDGYDGSSSGKRDSGEDGSGWLDGVGGGPGDGDFNLGDLLDGDSIAVGAVAVVVLGLLLFLLFPLLEAVIFAVLLAGGVASRVLLRRPWRVEVRLLEPGSSGRRAHWEVVGFRRSGAVTRQVAEHIAATGEPPSELSALPAGT
ncbi:MAG: hypothetical protein H0V22_01330 [Solirubrobacterales bacterium]|nr:hypothetical protein [Solirubrobacterales bacterium]